MNKIENPSTEELCVGCYCEVQLVIRLPAGSASTTVELFGPETEASVNEGYVANPVLRKIGSQLPQDIKMSTTNLREDAGQVGANLNH